MDQLPEAEEVIYSAKDAIASTIYTTGLMGGVGLFIAAVQTSLARSNTPASGVFTQFGGTITRFAAMGGGYEFCKTASANLREREDSWNKALGGAVAGAILGVGKRSFASVIGRGALLGFLCAAFDYTGNSFKSLKFEDEYDRRQHMKAHRRRPLEETISEIGEGRGIRPPGYEERRRERIKQRYGIDVAPES